MKLRLITDGTLKGTRIVDEDGNKVERITAFTLSWDIGRDGKVCQRLTVSVIQDESRRTDVTERESVSVAMIPDPSR